jgi:hypothetical protein
MKKLLHILILLGFTIVLSSCLKDDHFGKSSYNTLYSFVLEGQLGNATIDQNNNTVTINIDTTVDVTSLALMSYSISNFAAISPEVGETLDYSDTAYCTVTSESGIARVYKVVIQGAKQNEQISNSGFQQWYDTGNDYLEPGTGPDNVVWSTGNAGAVIAGNIPTYPEIIGDNDSIAVLETMKVILGPRIAAGSLFTGTFELNIADPPSSVKAGIPFTSRPTYFKIKMKYQPGDENQGTNGDPLTYDDSADIYALLEVRSGDNTSRLATAWYRSSETFTDWNNLEIPFTYGELDSSYPDFMKPADGVYADPASTPTHISVIMSSSARGDIFEGAIGSKLEVNDFELVY